MIRRIAAILLLTACACGGGREVHIVDPEDVPGQLFDRSAIPSGAPSQATRIWLVRDGRLASVERAAQADPSLSASVVRELFRGPTDVERQRGLTTAIPVDAELRALSISRNVAIVDVSAAFRFGADTEDLTLRTAQVVYTVTELPGVSQVRFLVDGEPELVADEQGRARDTVSRADFRGLATPPEPGGLA